MLGIHRQELAITPIGILITQNAGHHKMSEQK
jgi:hypothetical protein